MKTLPKPNNFRRTLLALAVTVLAACSAENDAFRVVGELDSDRVELTVESTEPLVEVLVADGARVSAGDLLARQDSRRAEARLLEAEASLSQARSRLAELIRGPRQEQIRAARANVEGARRDVDFRSSEHTRIRKLNEQDLASPDQLDRAVAALDAANANLDLREAQLEERLAGTTVEELQQAEAAVQRAEALVQAATVDLERHSLVAPVDGIIDRRLFEPGERPVVGQPVFVLLPGVQPHARVYVSEGIRASIEAGTKARIFVDGIDEPVAGRTRWVSSEAAFTPYYALTERDRGRLSYVAKVDVIGMNDRLPDGLPVEVEFVPGETLR